MELQGDLGARRASYEARWHTFVSSPASEIGLGDVPWLLEDQEDAKVGTCMLAMDAMGLHSIPVQQDLAAHSCGPVIAVQLVMMTACEACGVHALAALACTGTGWKCSSTVCGAVASRRTYRHSMGHT